MIILQWNQEFHKSHLRAFASFFNANSSSVKIYFSSLASVCSCWLFHASSSLQNFPEQHILDMTSVMKYWTVHVDEFSFWTGQTVMQINRSAEPYWSMLKDLSHCCKVMGPCRKEMSHRIVHTETQSNEIHFKNSTGIFFSYLKY